MAKKKKNKKDKPPHGLAISRSGLNFTLTWTPMKGSKKQDLKFYVKKKKGSAKENKKKKGWKLMWGGKKGQSVKANAKSKKCKLDPDNYYPKTSTSIYSVVFVLKATKGASKGKKAKWTKEIQKEYVLAKPGTPAYSVPQEYSSQAYTYTYVWGRNSKDNQNSKIHFASFEWQTVLANSSVASGKDLSKDTWKKYKDQKITTIDPTTGQTKTGQNSYGTGSSVTIIENPSVVNGNRRRFVRVRSRGAAGWNGKWRYIDHSFAAPQDTKIISASITSTNALGFSGTIKFNAPIANDRPVDNTEINYAVANPRTSTVTETEDGVQWVNSTISVPNGFSGWKTYRSVGATGKDNSLAFHIDEHISDDQCLFLRVNSIHDKETKYGTPYAVFPNAGKGFLTDPVLSSVIMNPAAETVEISATNGTTLDNNKSFIAVYFRTASNPTPEKPIGILPYGTATATFKIPKFSATEQVSFGIRTFVADYSPATYDGVLTYYDIRNIKMESPSIKWDNSAVPMPPSKPVLTRVKEGVIQVNWDWPWSAANSAELSWSDDPDAWTSTNGPSTYTVTNLYSGQWNISGLSAGTWYVRVRLVKSTDEVVVYGTYSEIAEINISSAPNTPTLTLEPSVLAMDGEVNAYWLYSSTDGTGQKYAELAEAKLNNETNKWEYTPLKDAVANSATHITFSPSTYAVEPYNWTEGSEHFISLRVTSGSDMPSVDWSNPVKLAIAEKPTISVSGIGGEEDPIHNKDIPIGDDGDDGIRTDLSLVRMPITFTVTGAGSGGSTTAVVTRRDNFDMPRPDDSTDTGYEGETIFAVTNQNTDDETSFEINIDDQALIGHFDDEAPYRLSVSITDTFGQTKELDQPIDFWVHWDDQAVMPTAIVQINTDDEIASIKPVLPTTGYHDGDYCQIYRLSADRPQIIVERAEFGTEYIDPYPTYGMFGGYRVVYVTKYGDYRDQNGNVTWADYEPDADEEQYEIDSLDRFAIVIDFDDDQVVLPGNISLSNSWKKDFQVTRYLGGSLEGDWKNGVERTGNYKATIPIEEDNDMAYKLRLLADYPDACHIRTPDGSNFYGNVDISEDRAEKWVNKIASVTMTVTKVDNVSDDGVPRDEWEIEDEE